MSNKKLDNALAIKIDEIDARGTSKRKEMIITEVKRAIGEKGPRFLIKGFGEKEFIKMNANSYLGMSLKDEVIEAEEEATKKFGAGPGAVRFISGSYEPHIALEKKLAEFHNKEAAMIFSAAYATSVGVLYSLIDKDTIIISDELNHNCIINGMRLTKPIAKVIYKHNDYEDLKNKFQEILGKGKRAVVITDGIFSMRGDHAPLKEIKDVCDSFDSEFEEGVTLIIDDSHGVGAFGATGRGTEEYTNTKSDVLIGTLGKAFGVNGGYVTGSKVVIDYLRENAPTYIYSNPITVGEAAAALKAIEILDSPEGKNILAHLKKLTKKFEEGLINLGFETIPGEHPVVPLMVRDTAKTNDIVSFLTENGILATGLSFPVVPKGDEEIRFQISADHTDYDIDYVLKILAQYKSNQ